jgi:hypothetical protein
MHDLRPSWKFVRQPPIAGGIAASSIGVVLNYAGREVRLSISLGGPMTATGPENELIMAELRLLQCALGTIVA